MRRMKSLVAMAILAAVVGLSTPSAFAAGTGIYLSDKAAVNNSNAPIYIGDFATGIIFSATGIILANAQAGVGIYISD